MARLGCNRRAHQIMRKCRCRDTWLPTYLPNSYPYCFLIGFITTTMLHADGRCDVLADENEMRGDRERDLPAAAAAACCPLWELGEIIIKRDGGEIPMGIVPTVSFRSWVHAPVVVCQSINLPSPEVFSALSTSNNQSLLYPGHGVTIAVSLHDSSPASRKMLEVDYGSMFHAPDL
ncbi:hypothetical protein GGR56DRAFT_98174 [Xylariaceae sp. FL0804]|nr:hypothetical protein GGR56DRAFT_98174 [Xylariaceae sp. FL0804]